MKTSEGKEFQHVILFPLKIKHCYSDTLIDLMLLTCCNLEKNTKSRKDVLLGLFDVVFSAEAFNTSGGIHQFLLARKEGVAGGTNFHFYILGGRTGFNYMPAGAINLRHFVLGVNLLSHANPP